MIGIVGGVGPYAGIDLLKNIYDNTLAKKDQDYLNSLLFSLPSKIQDRTDYLLGADVDNPGSSIAKIIVQLESLGATVVGIPCNTAHSEKIFSLILKELKEKESQIEVLHMINETIDFIKDHYSHFSKIGVLSTTGSFRYKIYSNALEKNGFTSIDPSSSMQEKLVHPAIYDPVYGIKANSSPFDPKAKNNLDCTIDYLKDKGAEAIILGCTEIPLVIKTEKVKDMMVINPTNVLARKLIEKINPKKLKPYKVYDKKYTDLNITS